MDAKVALRAADKNALAANDFIIRAQKKMNLLARMGEFAPIITSHGATANNGDFQARTKCWSKGVLKVSKMELLITSLLQRSNAATLHLAKKAL